MKTSKEMKKISRRKEYDIFLQEVKQKIRSAQYEALKAVNTELIKLYWDIGYGIVEKQDRHKWGKSIVENLAADLQKAFPGMPGYSRDNLWRMRKFYLQYRDNKKLAPLVQEISWSHNIVIMERCKDDLEREFYIQMTKRMNWSKNVLGHQIDNKTYEKMLVNQTNFKKSLPAKMSIHAKLTVKDEYTFDFLELEEEHTEIELERALIAKMNRFL